MAASALRDLTGNVAIITGAAQGLGKAFARAFLTRGGRVGDKKICDFHLAKFLVGAEVTCW